MFVSITFNYGVLYVFLPCFAICFFYINARSFYIPMINLMIFFATKFLVETKSQAKPNLVAENHLVA